MLTLQKVAERIQSGEVLYSVIQECVDTWIHTKSEKMFIDPPPITRIPIVDVWLGAAAELQASQLKREPPKWALDPVRYFDEPVFMSDTEAGRIRDLVETPSFFRKRLFFCGPTRMLST